MTAHVTAVTEARDRDMDRLALWLGRVEWARVTGRDEVEVAFERQGRSFLYLSPDGTWRTNGMHMLGEGAEGVDLVEGSAAFRFSTTHGRTGGRISGVVEVVTEAQGYHHIDLAIGAGRVTVSSDLATYDTLKNIDAVIAALNKVRRGLAESATEEASLSEGVGEEVTVKTGQKFKIQGLLHEVGTYGNPRSEGKVVLATHVGGSPVLMVEVTQGPERYRGNTLGLFGK